MIDFDGKRRLFHLKGTSSSYVLAISPAGDPHHLHWGASLGQEELAALASAWSKQASSELLEGQRREYASFGSNDLRLPALHLEHGDGSRLSAFSYQGHEVLPGKPGFHGLPGTYADDPSEASTLRLLLKDHHSGQLLDLFYTVYPGLDVVVRRALLKQGPEAGTLSRLMAASVDFPADAYHLLSLPGDWARERMLESAPLRQGALRLESRRGISSAGMSPFAAVTRGAADEERGEAFGFALAYSGNWLIEAEAHPSGRLRVNAGINDFDFKWRLEPGESFLSPECVLCYSGAGLGALSRKLHRLVRRHLLPRPWRGAQRPLLLNSWEARYFNFKHEDIVALAGQARQLGLDLLVLDDGWFGERDNDQSSLGDWHENTRKLPHGIKGLAQEVKALGLKFGLWFEPEAVSPVSRLYHEHPDWALAVPGRRATTSRHQFVLDLSRAEVRDYLFERLAHFTAEAGLDYIKWDMNRPLWEVGNTALSQKRQAELSHRYMLGVYELAGRLRDRFPGLLVEGCASGGGRFDFGMLAYHPQIWCSDNTDGLDRLLIQYGSSLFLPACTQTAHISAVPNHQTGRTLPLAFRARVAMAANLGLELDLGRLNAEEKEQLKGFLEEYRGIRHLVMDGDLYRLESPFDGGRAALAFVSEDRREAVAFVYQLRAPLLGKHPLPLRLRGLDPEARYHVVRAKQALSGAHLMHSGFLPELAAGDAQAEVLYMKAIS